jgi:hypothetical protein
MAGELVIFPLRPAHEDERAMYGDSFYFSKLFLELASKTACLHVVLMIHKQNQR